MSHQTNTPQSAFDPRGYWHALGIGPLASGREIAAAFKKMKRDLHPNSDPSEESALAFLVATEAYRVLSHESTRRTYAAQAQWRVPEFAPQPDDPVPDPLVCWRCGKITAQPRYLIFHQITGIVWAARRQKISGIFCRDCADRTAMGASTLTWLLGWWSPTGPFLTVAALLRNAAGGTRPSGENCRTLLHHARLFLDMGRHDAVRFLAEQARRFASTPDEEETADRYLDIVGREGEKLRDRWRRVSPVALIQGLSVAAVLFAAITLTAMLTLRASTDAVSAPIVLEPFQAGETRYVAVDALELRQGPRADAPVLVLLDRFTTIQILNAAPNGSWTHISAPNGTTGYAETRYLFVGTGSAPRSAWCANHPGDPPANGEVLMRRTGGDHTLGAVNATGKDVLVRLKSPQGDTIVAFFLTAGGQATITDIPDGVFSAMYATGHTYSRECESFITDMQAFRVPAQQMAMAGTKSPPKLILSPPGNSIDKPQPAPLGDFIDQ